MSVLPSRIRCQPSSAGEVDGSSATHPNAAAVEQGPCVDVRPPDWQLLVRSAVHVIEPCAKRRRPFIGHETVVPSWGRSTVSAASAGDVRARVLLNDRLPFRVSHALTIPRAGPAPPRRSPAKP